MRTSNAPYVISRKDAQYFPSSLSTITPTTSRVVRVPLTSGSDFIDPESIKVAFRFVNNDATNDFHPIMGHPACLIKRIQLFANGQRTDDIDNYARSVHLHTLKPREWWINQSNEGFEVNDTGGFPFALPQSHFQEVLMAPTLGLLGCGKMLPPQLNLVLEIEFADPADAERAALTLRDGRLDSVEASIATLQPKTTLLPSYTEPPVSYFLLAVEASVAAFAGGGLPDLASYPACSRRSWTPHWLSETAGDAYDADILASALDAILAQLAALTTGGGSNFINVQAWSGEITWNLRESAEEGNRNMPVLKACASANVTLDSALVESFNRVEPGNQADGTSSWNRRCRSSTHIILQRTSPSTTTSFK
ncbi:unnamed protein product [Symbiodinium pilosum]|uniref:Uncharacterized protein n=1 Tax=Symbiodinium pilosum TaxID=2952 RepID=A0A812R3I0_SYMPI|nr:unnamed protein product [Symbiodinium pilosum]